MKKAIILCGSAIILLGGCREAMLVDKVVSDYQEEKKAEEQTQQKARLEKARNSSHTRHNKGSNTTSEFTLKDGKMEGLATQSYPDGSIWKESPYEDGKLHGLAKVYYRDGKLKREVHYEHGKKHGSYTKYFKSGNPKAQIEYAHDLPLPGIVEYGYRGEKLQQPEITVREIDQLLTEGKYYFHFGLKGQEPEKIYVLLSKDQWSADNQELRSFELRLDENQEGVIPIELEKGYRFIKQLYVYATYKSKHGLDAVVMKEFTADALYY